LDAAEVVGPDGFRSFDLAGDDFAGRCLEHRIYLVMVSVAIVVEPYGRIGEGELGGQFAEYEGLYQRADEGGGLPGAPQAHSGEMGCEPGVGQEQFWRGDGPGGEVAGPGGDAAGDEQQVEQVQVTLDRAGWDLQAAGHGRRDGERAGRGSDQVDEAAHVGGTFDVGELPDVAVDQI